MSGTNQDRRKQNALHPPRILRARGSEPELSGSHRYGISSNLGSGQALQMALMIYMHIYHAFGSSVFCLISLSF